MSIKKKAIILMAAAAGILLLGFAVIPHVELSGDAGEYVELSYLNAVADGDALVITADYDIYGSGFEIAKDIVVATDRNFNNKLQQSTSYMENGKCIYNYNLPDSTSAVYIEPPVLYVPATVSPVTMAVQENAQATFQNSSGSAATAGKTSAQWFSISDVTITPDAEGIYCVRVMIAPYTTALPRFPKLCMGATEIGGLTSMNFNENNEFDFGEFIFKIPAESMSEAEAIVNGASLTVEEAMVRVEAGDGAAVSCVKVTPVVKE